MKGKGNYVDGIWGCGAGEEFQSLNPATGEVLWTGRASGDKDVDRAIRAARDAFGSWSSASFEERLKYLKGYQQALEIRAAELAECISRETGKPLWEAKTEVSAMTKKVDISVTAYNDRCKETWSDFAGAKSYTRFKPHGVVLVFGPFNLPGHLPNGHIVPALLAGDTVVFKPSEYTPAVAEIMAECFEQAGLPKGVFNCLYGSRMTGEALVRHDGFDGLFFTGSFRTGQAIHRAMAGRPEKILALEMGGNNPLIVTGVKDLKAAAYLTVQSAYITSGQRCVCARRLIVPEGNEGDQFLAVLKAMVSRIQYGPYTDQPEPFMGPLISTEAAQKVLSAQSKLAGGGAEIVVEVKEHNILALLNPGLIDVTRCTVREDEEIFGPLLQIIRVKNFDEAITEANNTAYGLSAGLLSDSKPNYEKFFRKSRAGVVNWNRQITGASSVAPFGGVGRSGNHQPSAYYAADYCSYPVASIEIERVSMPEQATPGLDIK